MKPVTKIVTIRDCSTITESLQAVNSQPQIKTAYNMADSTPKSDSAPPNSDLKVDDIVENSIGEFGRAQFFQTLLVSLAYLFDSQQVFISVFTDAVPIWNCTNNGTACTKTSNTCELSETEWSWDVHSYKTIVSEWDLQCANSFISGLPASSFYLGCVIGVLLSMLADSFLGRKKFLFLSCLIMSLAAFSATFSTNIWMYSALRFVGGFGRASIGTCIVVLLMETAGKGWRGRVSFIAFFCFALGFLSLPAIAYITKDSSWRRMYLLTSLPGLIYCLFLYFFAYESPRWLFLQGRNEEAVAVLKKLSSAAHCDYLEHIIGSHNLCLKQEKVKDEYCITSMKKLFEKGWACRRILIIMGLGCCLGLVYYGIPLGLGNLGFNLYWSVTFNAIIEVPSAFIFLFFVDRWNRRSSILTLFLVSGISCGICAITGSRWKGVKIGFELLAFFCACASCDFLTVFTVELFPTSVRNLATSLSRQSRVFGAVFSPMLISEGRKSRFFPYGVFGIVMIISVGLLCLLPETRGAKLCDTMDEQETKQGD